MNKNSGEPFQQPQAASTSGDERKLDLDCTDPEAWLLERLQSHGVDVYAPAGPFDCLRDRLAHAILDNRFGSVVVGRHNGKPENYEQLFERMYSVKLTSLKRQGAKP